MLSLGVSHLVNCIVMHLHGLPSTGKWLKKINVINWEPSHALRYKATRTSCNETAIICIYYTSNLLSLDNHLGVGKSGSWVNGCWDEQGWHKDDDEEKLFLCMSWVGWWHLRRSIQRTSMLSSVVSFIKGRKWDPGKLLNKKFRCINALLAGRFHLSDTCSSSPGWDACAFSLSTENNTEY